MDVFEQLVAEILRAEGYWVQSNYRVFLSRQDKADIGKPSCPDWELDLVAYKPGLRRLWVVECKSYVESGGIHAAMFDQSNKLAGRYKLFNDFVLREVVFKKLIWQLARTGLCIEQIKPRLALACAHITAYNQPKIDAVFSNNDWELLGPSWLRFHFEKMAVGGYENTAYSLIVKLAMNSKPTLDLPDDDPYGWRAEARENLLADQLHVGAFELPERNLDKLSPPPPVDPPATS